jgi:hypothetical protein
LEREEVNYKNLFTEVDQITAALKHNPHSALKKGEESKEESSLLDFEYDIQLSKLKSMGFTDEKVLKEALMLTQGDVTQASIFVMD